MFVQKCDYEVWKNGKRLYRGHDKTFVQHIASDVGGEFIGRYSFFLGRLRLFGGRVFPIIWNR